MQLDFGFARMEPATRIPALRGARPRASPAQQFEFFGVDRLQQHTFFFAVFVERSVTEAACRIRDGIAARFGLAGSLVDPARLHMSLLCLCKQSAHPLSVEAEQAAVEAARFVRLEPFEVVFDRVLTFGRHGNATAAQRPVVLTAARDIGIRALHQRLFDVLERARMVGGRLRPFTPHMTLLYDHMEVDEPIEPISATVREFHLVHSLHGKSQYRTVASFPLRG